MAWMHSLDPEPRRRGMLSGKTLAGLRHLLRVLAVYMVILLALAVTAFAEDRPADRAIREEVWAIPVALPTIAYVVRPPATDHSRWRS